jgi:uncharacterized protein YbbC (DUF1343 family)
MLQGIDILIYDIQDVGARFYTFISTMFESMKAASREGLTFIVLDRPNPIDGNRVEGPVLERGFESFVGIHPIPIRYGLTAGELASYLRSQAGLNLDLRVVPVVGWSRSTWFDETGLEWIAPSPNMPTLKTATLYPGICLIEGTNLSEGRGTTRPFELVGAPWLAAETLTANLEQLRLTGVRFRVQHFTPTFSKYQGETCRGLQIHVTDRSRFDPLKTALTLISETVQLHPQDFQFREAAFDRLAGNSWIREMIQSRNSIDQIIENWKVDLEEFSKRTREHLLY